MNPRTLRILIGIIAVLALYILVVEQPFRDRFRSSGKKNDLFEKVDPATAASIELTAPGKETRLTKEGGTWMVATDLMTRPVSVRPEDVVSDAARAMLQAELRELPVVDEKGAIIGFIDEADVARAYLQGDVPKQAPVGSPDDTWIPGAGSPWTTTEETEPATGEVMALEERK